MGTRETLHLAGHDYEVERGTGRWLTVVLPGRNYGPQMPVLYLPARLANDLGADVLRLSYPALHGSGSLEEVSRDVTGAVAQAIEGGDYDRVTVMGKSLGTVAMAALAQSRVLGPGTEAVWLTPLLAHPPVQAAARSSGWRSLAAVGTADPVPEADPAVAVRVMGETGGTVVRVPGGDHALEVAGDVHATVRGLGDLLAALRDFLAPDGAGRRDR